MHRLLAAPRRGHRRERGTATVACALCGAHSRVPETERSLLRRWAPLGPREEAQDAELGYCRQCLALEPLHGGHPHPLSPVNEDTAQKEVRGVLPRELDQLERKEHALVAARLEAEKKAQLIDEAQERLCQELASGMQSLREALAAKEAELLDAINRTAADRHATVSSELVRLEKGVDAAAVARNSLLELATAAPRDALAQWRDAQNALQIANSVPKTHGGQPWEPEAMGELSAIPYLLHALRRARFNPSVSTGASMVSAMDGGPQVSMGLQEFMHSLAMGTESSMAEMGEEDEEIDEVFHFENDHVGDVQ